MTRCRARCIATTGAAVFTDVSAASGVGALRANGLGVVVADYDDDGRPDVFVANDTMPNFLFHNSGNLRFTETGLVSGIAVGADGKARAGMGIDTGDYDADGRLDLVITNLDFEMHTLHRGLERGLFATRRSRAASAIQRCRSSASASPFSTSTTTRSSTSRSPTGTSSTTPLNSAPGPPTRSASSCSATLRCAASSKSVGRRVPGSPRRESAAGWRPATSTTTATSTCWSRTTDKTPSFCAMTAGTARTRWSFGCAAPRAMPTRLAHGFGLVGIANADP